MQPHLSLTLRQFEVFLRIAESRSFSEAGKILHVSQPALTRSIQQMEEALGARLFDRDTRRVDLTPVGIRLLPIARRVLTEVETSCIEIHHFVEGLCGKVHIAALPCVGSVMLSPVIAEFTKCHPAVDFCISESLAQNVSKQVADGVCDFGIGAHSAQDDSLVYEHLVDDDLFLICPRNDAIASQPTVPWSVFEKRRLVAMGRNCDVRSTAEKTISKLKLKVQPNLECDNVATARSLVESGLGLIVVSALMLPQILAGALTARRLVEPEVSHSLGIIVRAGRSLSPAAREFVNIFRKQAARQYGNITSLAIKRAHQEYEVAAH